MAAPVRLPAYGPAAGHSSGARPCFESAAGHACLSHGAARAPAGKHHAQAVQRGRVAMLNMGLEDRMQQPVGLLSGGQRQALTLMMATINPPMLLLLDEHTAALDPGAAEKILSLTTSIVEENGLTCLMVTHNMQSALELGSRTIMMDAGRVVMDVSGAEREVLEVADLLLRFKEISGKALNNDRMLLI